MKRVAGQANCEDEIQTQLVSPTCSSELPRELIMFIIHMHD